MSLSVKKDIEHIRAELKDSDKGLKKTLTSFNLVTLGIGAIIGSGIFVITGQAAALYSGPSIIISFLIAGSICAIIGMCYSEFAAMAPVSGSAYSYTYLGLGEIFAWFVGWNLILEYILGVSLVSIGWSGYFASLLSEFGIIISPELCVASGTHLINVPNIGWMPESTEVLKELASRGISNIGLERVTGLFNLPAVCIIGFMTFFLILGVNKSAMLNNIIVIIKLIVIILFVIVGFNHIHPSNYKPFIPVNTGVFGEFGLSGILRAAGVVFLAYLGFDAVSTAAQECKKPSKSLPIGIIGSLSVSTILYILVAFVLTGVVSYRFLDVADPIAIGVNQMGEGYTWLRLIVKFGAVAGLSSVILVLLLGQPRIFFTISNDGLLPKFFGKVHKKYKTPYVSTLICGFVCSILGAFVDVNIIGQMISIGTLFAFVFVCISLVSYRKNFPHVERPFKTPWVPTLPIIGAIICLVQIAVLPHFTQLMVLYWMMFGLVIYLIYGYRNSKMRKSNKNGC